MHGKTKLGHRTAQLPSYVLNYGRGASFWVISLCFTFPTGEDLTPTV